MGKRLLKILVGAVCYCVGTLSCTILASDVPSNDKVGALIAFIVSVSVLGAITKPLIDRISGKN